MDIESVRVVQQHDGGDGARNHGFAQPANAVHDFSLAASECHRLEYGTLKVYQFFGVFPAEERGLVGNSARSCFVVQRHLSAPCQS